MSTEEDFDIVSDEELSDIDELDDEEDIDELDDEEEVEVDEEDDEEEEEEVEEEVEDEVEEEEEVEVEEEVEEIEEEEELSFKDVYHEDDPVRSTRRQKTRIERYCKSLNESCPRDVIPKECLPSQAYNILKEITTEKNALAFSSYVTSKKQLYSICGKMLIKEIGNKELFQELKAGVNEWNSVVHKKQKNKEEMEIRIMTTKMDVVEGLYHCKRCGSAKTYSRQVQTRSADEGMTSIIQCSKCSMVWREYA